MSKFRFRPSFDTMDRRITPSDLVAIGTGGMDVGTAGLEALGLTPPPLPGTDTDVLGALDNCWLLGGSPQTVSINLDRPPVELSDWVVGNPFPN